MVSVPSFSITMTCKNLEMRVAFTQKPEKLHDKASPN